MTLLRSFFVASRVRSLRVLTAALICGAVALASVDAAFANDEKTEAPPPKTRKEMLQIQPNDIILGDEDAPVTIIEYASLSCGHCASFHNNTLPQLKENYIDTGKARLILRDFPLNRYAVFASQIARCAPEEKFYDYAAALFAAQSHWMSKEINEQLLGIARLGGMTPDEFEECIGDKETVREIMESRFYGSDALDVKSTPTFFINEIQYEGGKNYEFFASVIDKLLASHEKSKPAKKASKPDESSEKEPEKTVTEGDEDSKDMQENHSDE